MKQFAQNTKLVLLPTIILLALSLTLSSAKSTSIPAPTPEPQSAEWAQKWWMPRHEEKLAQTKALKEKIQLLFIGDSITHSWEKSGKAIWNEYYTRRNAFNLGFSGDRTEQVLWRLQHGAVAGLSPKLVVLMIGTNNTGHRMDPASDTAAGVTAILQELRKRLPQSKILLLAVFPRGAVKDDPKRVLNDQINQRLKTLADGEWIHYLDINHVFLEKNGRLPKNIMPDLLHPNAKGYRLWARAMEPPIQKLLGEKPKQTEPVILPLWPTTVPGKTTDRDETMRPAKGDNVQRVTHVSVPTLAVYPIRQGKKTKPAVLICPGGGYHILAYNLEGTEIAQWLNNIGVAAAVLKYRVPQNRDGALQDAQRALGLLRARAREWAIDPNRIGVLGFSAGGHLSATLSNHYAKRFYPLVDSSDSVSCRPDFTVLVYPAYLGDDEDNLIGDIPVTNQTPPAFIVQTQDDKKHVSSSVAYYRALSRAGVAAELHLFPTGGHGYGLRPGPYPVLQWPELCGEWMKRLD